MSKTTTTKPQQPVASAGVRRAFVEIELPLAPVDEAAFAPHFNHIEVRLGEQEARFFRSLQHGLDQAGKRLSSGRRVTSRADTVKWLLEALAAGTA